MRSPFEDRSTGSPGAEGPSGEGGILSLRMEASAAQPPRAAAPPGADWLRMIGGVVFAVGAVVLFICKLGFMSDVYWAAFPLLLVVGVPCGLLFGLGVSKRRVGEVERWRAVLMVTGVLLAPIALEQLRKTLGISATLNFWQFVIFSATAGMAAYASFVVGASYQAFLAGVAGIVAWLYLWEWILSNPGVNAFRWLLVILGLGYLAAAAALRASNAPQGDELVTVAALVGVLVGFIGVSQVAAQSVSPFGVTAHGQGFFWDLVLLLVSLAAVGYAARNKVRGPGYLGVVGLLIFAVLVGFEINSVIKREVPDGSLVGWPLAMLLIGGAALAAGIAAERRINR